MKRVRKIVRGLNWSIRLERLEDRLPLDGGLGAIAQGQLQSIYFDYSQIQSDYSSNQYANSGVFGGPGQDLYSFEAVTVDQSSKGSIIAAYRDSDNSWGQVRSNAVGDLLIGEVASDRGHIPIPNPIMIPLPTSPELVAIAQPIEGSYPTPVRERSELAKGRDSKEQKAIEPTMRIGESNGNSDVSTQSTLENVAINAIFPDHAMRDRAPSSTESSIKQPVENVRSANSEPFAQTTESRSNRISRDMYYERTDAANDRQELGWTTDVLASATRQQVISESSALLAIIASNVSKSAMFNNQSNKDAVPVLIEPNVRFVSHGSHYEPQFGALETNHPPVTDDSKRQSTGSVEVGTNQSTNEGMGFLHSSWGTYFLVLAGMTLSMASSENREIPSEPELLTSKTSRLFPLGKESV